MFVWLCVALVWVNKFLARVCARVDTFHAGRRVPLYAQFAKLQHLRAAVSPSFVGGHSQWRR